MTVPTSGLLERDSELAAIEAGLRAVPASEAGPLIVEGEAGAGKTALLEEGVRRAAGLGLRVLRARGGEYEREFPYGVVRQLFEPALDLDGGRGQLSGAATMARPAFEGVGAEDPFSIQHGLYWLVAELAEATPLLIAVDDAQWADAASLRALLYIGRRLEGMRAGLVLTVRTGSAEQGREALEELCNEPGAVLLGPSPLSVTAVAALAAERTGSSPSERFAEVSREVTGGNPFLLAELFRALDAEDFDLAGEDPGRLARLAATGASTAILSRLARLGKIEAEVARAVAILEPRGEVRLVAAASEHPVDEVTAAGARLASASLFSDGPLLAFAHPLVREAVLTDMGERARRTAHARAARLLDADGAGLDTVAAHLLLAEPMGEGWVVGKLREAAASAIGRGAPETAVGYLRRALEEPPPDQRLAVKRELGLALLRHDDEEGVGVLREVHARATTREERAEVAAVLSNSLMFRARHVEAEAILHDALEENLDRTDLLAINLHLHLLLATLGGFERIPARYLPAPEDEVATDLVEGRAILSQSALLYALGMGPMSAVPILVEKIGSDPVQARTDAHVGYPGTPHQVALCLADRGDQVLDRFPNLLAGAETRGTLSGVTGVHGSRAYCRFLDGELSEAQADAETAIRISVDAGFKTPLMSWLGAVTLAMTARGEAETAIALVDGHVAGTEVPPGIPGALALIGRGRARQALGRHAEACEDFRAARSRVEWIPWGNPEGIGWRPGLALSLAALGEAEEAAGLATEGVELAEKAGGPRGIGVALRARGLIAGGEEGVEALRRSVALLAETRAQLQYAESLVELGAALRRSNCRKEAREPLAEGLEIAHSCGAAPLEERARTELAASGARPRGVMRSGVEALTPSELRVARMAAAGKTNREIAQILVVTPKTVETHLRHVYQKLDVAKRAELGGVLSAD